MHAGLIPWGLDSPSSLVFLNPPPGVRTETIEAGLDARKACVL